ncbi:hypothetical protein ISCGN_018773 [Ixodes scapularis]
MGASAHPPDIILLQEARMPEPKIVGYRAFSTPTIIVAQKGPRRKRDAQGTIPVPQAHAHVLLKKSIPAAQLDTSCYSSEQREVTAVSARLGDKDIVVVSVYWRPHSTTNDEDAEWLKLLCTRTIHPLPVLIGGDFNAHHTSWGSKSNTVRGRSVADNALVAGLVLANSPDAVTRRADSQQQDSTSPDVTWHSPSLRCSWAVVDDTWGSDHFPIIIGLGGKSRALATRTVSTTRWDDFREVLAELPPHEPLFNRIIQAKEIVTRSVKVSAEAPTPDQHLLNLWESRIKAQHCYLEGGKLPPDRTRFNRASAEAKRYSLELSGKEWHDHCTSFNGRTSPAKVWATMRGMTKNQRQQTAGEDMALRLAISNEEFASKAGPVFFPQECPASYDPAKVRFSIPPPQEHMDPSMERPFTMAELQGALFSITKLHGAPGPDMITVPALRNLPEAAMQELLDIFNESWELGQLPAIWRHASVIPIPKPGRTPKQLTDMRPISLTSHVGKLMERMALMRLEWHIEANNVLHPCQTGFRRGLSTQDSLALFTEDLAGKHPRYDIKIAVAIDVKKAFDSVPHPTVMAAASAAGLTGKPLQYIRAFLNGRTYILMILNLAVGLIFAFRGRALNSNTDETFLGSRTLGILPLSMSILASLVTAIGLVGYTAHFYTHGLHLLWVTIPALFSIPFISRVIVPVIYKLGVTSVFENSSRRHSSSTIRLVRSLSFLSPSRAALVVATARGTGTLVKSETTSNDTRLSPSFTFSFATCSTNGVH